MNHISSWALNALVLASAASSATAADYVPIGQPATPPIANASTGRAPAAAASSPGILGNIISKAFGAKQTLVEVRGPASAIAASGFPTCATPPTSADIGGSFDVYRHTMSRSAAAKLNIVGGMGSVDSSGEEMIAVFEFSRSKDCLATDGRTRMVYGQAIRTALSFSSVDGKMTVSFPVVAASATMAGKASTVRVKNIGFNDPVMAQKAVAMSAIQLDVGTYAEFNKLHTELVNLATAAGIVTTVELLGMITEVESDEYKSTLLSAFAIQAIKDGKSCEDAKSKVKLPGDTAALRVIDSTYVAIAGKCSTAAPDSTSTSKAQGYLLGMTVKR